MKERPILMTPENAQKCHVGTKMQTRRLVKPQPTVNEHVYFQWTPRSEGHNGVYTPDSFMAECPYGVPGDRLWVRESLYARGDYVTYSDGTIVSQGGLQWPSFQEKKVIPSIHMPRWACRTVVDITEIRVQRVQEISEEDAKAEGINPAHYTSADLTAVDGFFELWESINGPGSWDANPWVWAISFRKVQP